MEIIKERGDFAAAPGQLRQDWASTETSGKFEEGGAGVVALIVHEDLRTGLRAREALAKVEELLELETHFVLNLYRFGMLEDPELAKAATEQAQQSDIVFLSLHGDRDIPPAVRDWLLNWLETKDLEPCALVISLDAATREVLESNSTLNFLRAVTAPLKVDLFLHAGAAPSTALERTTRFNRQALAGRQ